MKRKPSAPVFKPYVMNQIRLMPPNYEEKIPACHLVRKVNEASDKLDANILKTQFIGGWTSSYDPAMLLKMFAFGFCDRPKTGEGHLRG